MNFIWAGNRNKPNTTLVFSMNLSQYKKGPEPTILHLCAVDFYCVFSNNQLISYGPSRAPAGFSRIRKIDISNADNIEIVVSAYNLKATCLSCDIQPPFFGAKILQNDVVIASSLDFKCRDFSEKLDDTPRFGYQRGFVEIYDYTITKSEDLTPYLVESPILLEDGEDTADYALQTFNFLSKSPFIGFDEVNTPWWEGDPNYAVSTHCFDIQKKFLDETKNGNYIVENWILQNELTGFIRLDIDAQTDTTIFVAFEEFLPNKKWLFRRDHCNAFVSWKIPKGKMTVMNIEPYSIKHLKLIYQGEAKIIPSIVRLENATTPCVQFTANNPLKAIFDAAEASFRQNAVDIFTDCPSRERAGWLCDSYFTAIAERLFTGNNNIERRFLENYILGTLEEIPQGMLPDCYPAQHADGNFIPNWAMWFILELEQYLIRTKDEALIRQAKKKVYDVIHYFDPFINEDGLLENLQGWIFVEWSICNSKDYVAGVNYPSNILFAAALSAVARLYNDESLFIRSKKIKDTIIKQAFLNGFFIENAIRINGKLVPQKDHITETCQYYALFFDMPTSETYKQTIIKEFGPFRKDDCYPKIAKSNMFIGNYLRFMWLLSQGERERILTESIDVFTVMANATGTLWENLTPHASCNHAFASIIAPILLDCTIGYQTIENNVPIFNKNFIPTKDYGITVDFSYPYQEELTIKG